MDEAGELGSELNPVRFVFELELDREWDFMESISEKEEVEDDSEIAEAEGETESVGGEGAGYSAR